jgi:hypothetical protein
VDYEDAEGLRRAIRWVLDHPEAARRMGQRARERAAGFTTERCMRTVHDLVLDAAGNGSWRQPRTDRPNPCVERRHDASTTSNLR